jgi:peptide-methionine (S)-S-oxide reductase
MRRLLLPALVLAGFGSLALSAQARTDKAVPIPAARLDVPRGAGPQTAVFAGGCFWGMSAVFEQVKGVTNVVSGYAGGRAATATYDQVSSETTGHAEAVKVTYDPARVSYATLLRVYFSVAHDPTQVNAQYPDQGTSYRSAIFPQTPEQAKVARAYLAQLGAAHAFGKPIATRVESGRFFPAEAYHQHFFDKNPSYPYIVAYDKPKVAAFKAAFPQLAAR